MKLYLAALGELLGRYGRAFAISWRRRKELDGIPRKRDEAEFLPAVLALQDTPTSPAPHVALWAIISLLTLTVVWACFGRIDVVAVATGKVVPTGSTKIIQANDTARIAEIKVEDGQVVNMGDTLLILDKEATQADVSRLNQALAAAQLDVAQGRALDEAIQTGRLVNIRPIANIDPNLAQDAQDRVNRQLNEYQTRRAQLEAQMLQLNQQQQSIREQLQSIAQTLPIVRQQEADYQNMLNQDYLPRHTLLDKQRQRLELEGNQATLNSRLAEITASIETIRRQQNTLAAEMRRSAADTIQQGQTQAAQIEQELIKAQRQNRLMTITAPVSGTVQQLAVHTLGGVVTPAQALMAIVPKDTMTEVEAVIENKDIGFVMEGQTAAVKIDTFKFTKYGTLPAKVVSISQDAINDERRGLIFNARVQLEKDWLDIDGRRVTVQPGMSVSVEIKTGKRRVIEYFLTPLLQHGNESLKER
ncbi:MAG: HlyD family type I secretion periplasmic adaptor subunit [Pseudomonadota bacterium]|nr:HlyD family type I secretion periplasmic adaptor subunit [Pseudomonadota bacterium]